MYVSVLSVSVSHLNIVSLPCVTCMVTRSTSQHILLCFNWSSHGFWWLCDQCLFPSLVFDVVRSLSLDFFFPPSQWMWILTFYFDSLKDVPLHDCLHLTVCLFISLIVLFFAELCVIMKWGCFPKCIMHQIFTLCLYEWSWMLMSHM